MSYYLNGRDYEGNFNIDRQTGDITTITRVQYSLGYSYNFFVVVTASGFSEVRDVTVVVSAYNSYAPTFTQARYDVYLFRLTFVGTDLVTVTATDGDVEEYNRRLEYDVSGGSYINYFRLDGDTGRLTLGRSLAEANDDFDIVVRAKDNGYPPREDSVVVGVHLSGLSCK